MKCMHWVGECGLCTVRRHAPPGLLTAQQLQILERVAAGQGYVEIGEALFLHESTVAVQMHRARAALGVQTTPQAVDTAWRLGLLGGELRLIGAA